MRILDTKTDCILMALDKDHKKQLRGVCQGLKPVVTLGPKGLTESVTAEIEGALDQHELIKVKLRGDSGQRTQWIAAIGRLSGAELIQKIGHTACFFRRRPGTGGARSA